MRGLLQDGLRTAIGWSLILLGGLCRLRLKRRIRGARKEQRRLHQLYGLDASPPIQGHGPAVQSGVDAWAKESASPVYFAQTSGSTGVPKRIAYTKARVRETVGQFIASFAHAYWSTRPSRKSFYVLSSLQKDASLTSLMLDESAGFPPYLSGLQAPYRVQSHPDLRRIAEDYGANALRVWVLALSNPGVLYCTNPSTLSAFLTALEEEWDKCRSLVAAWHQGELTGNQAMRSAERRLMSRGGRQRIARLAELSEPPRLHDISPAIECYFTWDGGYVAPFLEQLDARLEDTGVVRYPMYSMSTEVVETLPFYRGQSAVFLPIAKGVRYEFLPLGASDVAAELLESWQLIEGEEYTLVVSDAYGLIRYQTEDVFLCVETSAIGELPDLRFQRRRGLRWSFTGEKLTGEQVAAASLGLRSESPVANGLDWIAMAPSQPPEGNPGYVLFLVGTGAKKASGLSAAMDALLCAENPEFKAKLQSGRLAPSRTVALSKEEYIALVGGDRHSASWEAQFKFLPLVTHLFEDL